MLNACPVAKETVRRAMHGRQVKDSDHKNPLELPSRPAYQYS
jgi:hypothetical protein